MDSENLRLRNTRCNRPRVQHLNGSGTRKDRSWGEALTEENVFNVIWEKDKEILDETVQIFTASWQVEVFRNMIFILY